MEACTVYLRRYAPVPVREQHKTEHALGRELLAQGLRALYGLPPQTPETAPEGKPFLPGRPEIQFSISHCDGLVGCAFFSAPIGLDLEKLRPYPPHVPRKVLTEAEQTALAAAQDPDETFFRFWTLKESRIKQAGRGLAMPMDSFSFTLAPLTCSEAGLWFHQALLPDGYLLALCADRPFGQVRVIDLERP